MAAEEAPPHGRSSSRAPRPFRDIQASEARSFFASKSSKKSQQKIPSDKLVWFSPVHSPLLSPAREKTLQSVKKKVRQSSIFSIQSRGKGSIEAEEPTSPKVSCIGQVRAHKKDKDPFSDAVKKKSSQSKPGSMSPARFFASPGRSSKWGSLFGSRKDSCASTPSSSGYGEGGVSCFGLPFEARSAFQTDKTCAFLARSLDLFEERGNLDNFHKDKEAQLSRDYGFEKQGMYAVADGCTGGPTHHEVESHACAATSFSNYSSQHEEAYVMACASMPNESEHHGKKLTTNYEPRQNASFEKSAHEDCHRGKSPASKQRLTYEELPSLHCGPSSKKNMKVSVEVVPETWLWRNGERLRLDGTSHLGCVPEQSVSTGREHVENVQQGGEANMAISPCCESQVDSRVAEECVDHQVLPFQSQLADIGTLDKLGQSGDSLVEAESVPVVACQPVDANDQKKDDSHVAALPYCTHTAPLKEKSEESRTSRGSQGGANGAQNGKERVHFEKPESVADVEKNRGVSGSFVVKPGQQMLRRIGVDVGKENYSIALPQLLEKSLPSLHSKEDGKRLWSIFKSRKSDPYSAQPFSALILVGYDQCAASKDTGRKDEELLKGIIEVGRLSFHGSGKYFQVLNSDAAFNRSRSATSHRTVVRLQRCNSDPCRPSC